MSRDGGKAPRIQDLLAENAALRAKLEEAEETLRAIREGEVDAIVVSGSHGEQVFSLSGAESVYRLIVETMKEAALTVTTDGQILFCNHQFSALVQTPPERILGRPLAEFVVPDQRTVVASLLIRSQSGSAKDRLVFQGLGGPPVPAHVSATALCQADSLSICLVATDLTELEASTDLLRLLQSEQAALRASEEAFRAFFETAAVGTAELDLDGRFLRVNDRYCDLTGFAREELLGRTPADLAPPEDRAADQAQLAAYLQGSQPVFDVEKRYVRKDGRILWVRVSAAPIRDATGRPLRSAGIIQDITARKQADAVLARTNAYLSDILESIQDDFYVLNRDWTFAFASKRFTSRIGKEPKDFIGKNIWEMFPNHVGTILEESFRATMATREIRRFEMHGEYTDAWYSMTSFPSAEGITVLGVDITDRKQAEGALHNLNATLEQRVSDRTAELAETVEALQREAVQRLEAEAHLQRTNQDLRMLSACNEMLVRIDDEARLMHEICRIAVEIGGYRMAWVGLAENDAERSVRPVASTGIEGRYLEAARITWADTERGRGPTGMAIRLGQVQIGTDFLTEPRLAPWRAEAIKHGFRSSIALPLHQGESVFGALTIYAAEPAVFAEAQVKVLLELAEDLAFGIHALRLRTALRESRDRLRALAGELTLAEHRERRRIAQVLHDHLQQLLVGAKFQVVGLARTGDGEIRQAAQGIQALLEESLTVSRSLTAELSPPILAEAGVTLALEWLARWMADKHGLAVELAVEPDVPAGAGDVRVLLYEAVRELLFNVVKHAGVKSASVTLRRGQNGQVQIVVADSGVGFDPATLTPASADAGGFGLFSVRERLELVGGRLEVESAPGQGSRFTLTVPLGAPPGGETSAATTAPAPSMASASQGPSRRLGPKTRVLVVDDHPMVRQTLARMIGSEPDIQVVGEAANAERAIALTRQLLPDVVLLDVSMPGMDGVEATRRIHAECPAVQVIGLSMYDETEKAKAMREAGAVDYLDKTSPADVLFAAIRASLDRK
ncbi:MAG TPA: PAS domain S-box protein [Candidatus Methylomirabilis sp.]|nr:PAS domain S-box protein [Candidatus Methylomirabilis sp.]